MSHAIKPILIFALTAASTLIGHAEQNSSSPVCPERPPQAFSDSDVIVRLTNTERSRPIARLVFDRKWDVDLEEGATFVKRQTLGQAPKYSIRIDKVRKDFIEVTVWQPEGECFYSTKTRLPVSVSDG